MVSYLFKDCKFYDNDQMACLGWMSEYVKNESQHKVFAEESLESTFMIFMFVNCINYHKTNLFTQQRMLYYYFS